MVDVLLVNPYVLSRHEPRKASYRPYPPLGLMYLAAVLREAGFTVEVYDATFLDRPDRVRERLAHGERPRVVGVFAMNSFRDDALAMIDRFKEAGLLVWAGGPDPSIYDTEYLEAGADVVVRGEGEAAILELMEAFRLRPGEISLPVSPDPQVLLQIPGVSTVNAEARPDRAPDRTPSKSMDHLPMPAYDLVDLPRYMKAWKEVHGYASIQFMTSRGCPFSCAWCARPIFGRRYRQYNAERAAEEVAHLVTTYGVDHLWLFDDTFVVRREWVEAFTDAIIAKGVKIRWECLARVDLVDRELLARMKAAGCERINFGFESGSQRVLDRMKKGITVNDARRVAKDMHELGISMGGYVLMGYPGEEWPDIERTIELLRDIQPVDYSTSVALPMPGTEFFSLVRDMMDKEQRWADVGPDSVIWDAPYSRGFYRLVESLMHAEYDLGLEFSVRRMVKAKLLRGILRGMHALQRDDRKAVYQSDRFKGWEGLRRPEHSARHRQTHAAKAAEVRKGKGEALRVLS
ncbi:MAG: radical SAM protein [Deltaproteobacteria bacterium]|nr:radical SAM protein [Deltaproteobacteria bacterium]